MCLFDIVSYLLVSTILIELNMNKQQSLKGLSFSKIKPEEFQEITDLINAAYRYDGMTGNRKSEMRL